MFTNSVFVIDQQGNQLKPCSPVRARKLQKAEKAKKFRLYPFTLILQSTVENPPEPYLELRIDPGSKATGFALATPSNEAIWGMELTHRGLTIKSDLIKRAGFRRGRRSRNLRYRKKRFDRKKPEGWLAPSLMHRVHTTRTWIARILKYAPVKSIAVERVKFDMQKMVNPDIGGIDYQRGTLAGFTLREALLEHWGRDCVYCGASNVPLQVEHIVPKSKGGSDRFNNLCMACGPCNQAKGSRDVKDFLKGNPDILTHIQKHRKEPLSDAAAVNATRNAIFDMALSFGLPVAAGDGGSTKWVRTRSGLEKAHWVDAACTATKPAVTLRAKQPLEVTCKGHGDRQSRRVNDSGFPVIANLEDAPSRKPRENGKPRKRVKVDPKTGLKTPKYIQPKKEYAHAATGDAVRVLLRKDRLSKKGEVRVKAGTYTARVKTPTASGVEVKIGTQRVAVPIKDVQFVHQKDGYAYGFKSTGEDCK